MINLHEKEKDKGNSMNNMNNSCNNNNHEEGN